MLAFHVGDTHLHTVSNRSSEPSDQQPLSALAHNSGRSSGLSHREIVHLAELVSGNHQAPVAKTLLKQMNEDPRLVASLVHLIAHENFAPAEKLARNLVQVGLLAEAAEQTRVHATSLACGLCASFLSIGKPVASLSSSARLLQSSLLLTLNDTLDIQNNGRYEPAVIDAISRHPAFLDQVWKLSRSFHVEYKVPAQQLLLTLATWEPRIGDQLAESSARKGDGIFLDRLSDIWIKHGLGRTSGPTLPTVEAARRILADPSDDQYTHNLKRKITLQLLYGRDTQSTAVYQITHRLIPLACKGDPYVGSLLDKTLVGIEEKASSRRLRSADTNFLKSLLIQSSGYCHLPQAKAYAQRAVNSIKSISSLSLDSALELARSLTSHSKEPSPYIKEAVRELYSLSLSGAQQRSGPERLRALQGVRQSIINVQFAREELRDIKEQTEIGIVRSLQARDIRESVDFFHHVLHDPAEHRDSGKLLLSLARNITRRLSTATFRTKLSASTVAQFENDLSFLSRRTELLHSELETLRKLEYTWSKRSPLFGLQLVHHTVLAEQKKELQEVNSHTRHTLTLMRTAFETSQTMLRDELPELVKHRWNIVEKAHAAFQNHATSALSQLRDHFLSLCRSLGKDDIPTAILTSLSPIQRLSSSKVSAKEVRSLYQSVQNSLDQLFSPDGGTLRSKLRQPVVQPT